MKTTPFDDLKLSTADLESLPTAYPDLERAFVRVHAETQAGDDPVSLQRRIRELCPRCLDVSFSGEGLSATAVDLPARPRDYAETALGHLRQVYAGDPDLPELERRANELLREVSDASTTN